MTIAVSREQIFAFRLTSHQLSYRLPAEQILTAAGACGIQNTPPGAAELSLHARLEKLEPGIVRRSLEKDKSLLQAWSLRGSHLIFFRLQDAFAFTLGLLPPDEKAMRFFLYATVPVLDRLGLSAVELVNQTSQALLKVMDGQACTKDELGVKLAGMIAHHLTPAQLLIWKEASSYAAGQSLGESMVRFALPVTALQGVCCHAERVGEKAYLRRSDQWLANGFGVEDPQMAKCELLRRYLHCYGPSTPTHFAAWAGISPDQASQTWRLVEPDLVETGYASNIGWILREDQSKLLSPTQASGVRLLPAHDPYLQGRDRELLVPQPALQRQVWKSAGSPGVVLIQGEFGGTWRMQKKGQRLEVEVTEITNLDKQTRELMKRKQLDLRRYGDAKQP